jgi:hypothetical protein
MKLDDFKLVIPGVSMGIVRAAISHPFEIMKLKSQINQSENFYKNVFKGIHYSIGVNAFERGVQFGLYEKFKLNDNNITSSAKASIISTCIGFPYNIVMLRKVVMSSTVKIKKEVFAKAAGLEYCRNLSGSVLFLSSYNFLKEKDTPIFLRAPLASWIVWLSTYPVDSYKNMMLSQKKPESLNIFRLYKGIQYPLVRSVPSSIVGFYVYEYMLKCCK